MPKKAMATIRKVTISSDDGTRIPRGRSTKVAARTTTMAESDSAASAPEKRTKGSMMEASVVGLLHQFVEILEHLALLGCGLGLPLILHL